MRVQQSFYDGKFALIIIHYTRLGPTAEATRVCYLTPKSNIRNICPITEISLLKIYVKYCWSGIPFCIHQVIHQETRPLLEKAFLKVLWWTDMIWTCTVLSSAFYNNQWHKSVNFQQDLSITSLEVVRLLLFKSSRDRRDIDHRDQEPKITTITIMLAAKHTWVARCWIWDH